MILISRRAKAKERINNYEDVISATDTEIESLKTVLSESHLEQLVKHKLTQHRRLKDELIAKAATENEELVMSEGSASQLTSTAASPTSPPSPPCITVVCGP